jgi:predicted GH43/DUF377 family glycosyl hydrolase
VSVDVVDAGVELRPDLERVVARLFIPGSQFDQFGASRSEAIIDRVLALTPEQLAASVAELKRGFGSRHRDLAGLLQGNAALVRGQDAQAIGDDAGLVLGAAFTAEYTLEGAALCNPSVVAHPDQDGLVDGQLRVLLSLRAIGEPHLSSIEFCTAVIGPGATWSFDPREVPLAPAVTTEADWDSATFQRAVEHHGRLNELARAVIQALPARFTSSDIERVLADLPGQLLLRSDARSQLEAIRLAAKSAYRVAFDQDSAVSQRVLMPAAEDERHGVEDARFVRFTADDGTTEYRATFTAFDGGDVASKLLTTDDFSSFTVRRLTGAASRSKGMALFPRPIGGRLFAITRSGGEQLSVARSEDGLSWPFEVRIPMSDFVWELVQTGNCGSPIETDQGWLVLTHGVGPLRRYSISAILLDLDDPTLVVGRLDQPLLEPDGDQRDGYVPNVVYSCGAIVHDGMLWIPYGIGDDRIRVAYVPVSELLSAMTGQSFQSRSSE